MCRLVLPGVTTGTTVCRGKLSSLLGHSVCRGTALLVGESGTVMGGGGVQIKPVQSIDLFQGQPHFCLTVKVWRVLSTADAGAWGGGGGGGGARAIEAQHVCTLVLPGLRTVGVAAPPAHRVRTAATIGSQTPMNQPKMYPPKQPIEPQKTSVASTPPVFLGFLYDCQYFPKASGWFLFFPGGLLTVAIITGRGPRYTPSLHCARTVARAASLSCVFGRNLSGLLVPSCRRKDFVVRESGAVVPLRTRAASVSLPRRRQRGFTLRVHFEGALHHNAQDASRAEHTCRDFPGGRQVLSVLQCVMSVSLVLLPVCLREPQSVQVQLVAQLAHGSRDGAGLAQMQCYRLLIPDTCTMAQCINAGTGVQGGGFRHPQKFWGTVALAHLKQRAGLGCAKMFMGTISATI